MPYDRPVVGYGGRTINTLRLWSASAAHSFDFQRFSEGDFVASMAGTLGAESLTRVLYPDDSTQQGRGLRLMQEYFLVACSLADVVRRFRETNADWRTLPEKAAIQMNDTHPTLAVPELMRILLDGAGLSFDEAWDITKRTLAYTNHTLLPDLRSRPRGAHQPDRGGPEQPASPRQPERSGDAAGILLGGARVPPRQNHHQVRQQPCPDDDDPEVRGRLKVVLTFVKEGGLTELHWFF
jgi:hypothetical protein